ncbi:MAG: hypothetical protein K2X87_05800 [Gemmataceae bacterium]|nr:hypothetical protein [Gemmataceae bacterium]
MAETKRVAACAAAVLWGLAAGGHAHAQPKTVKVDFDSTAAYRLNTGERRTAVPSLLLAETRAAILARAQAKFDAALGAGVVTLSEGRSGDIDIIMSGEAPPLYGNVGRPGRPGVVYTETFRTLVDAGGNLVYPSGDPFRNAAAETLAHEIGHKLGVAHNPRTDPYTIMTEGFRVPPAVRAQGVRQFTAADVKVMTTNLPLAGAEFKIDAFSQAPPAGGEQAGSANPQMIGDNGIDFSALATFAAPPGAEFGFIGYRDEFVFQGDLTAADLQYMTFDYSAPIDFAVRFADGTVYRSSDPGVFDFGLLDPNPNRTDRTVYRTLVGEFDTPQGTATLRLDVAAFDPESAGGFVAAVPGPSGVVLAGVGAAAVAGFRAGRRVWGLFGK